MSLFDEPATVDGSALGAILGSVITERGWVITCERGKLFLSLDQFEKLRATFGPIGNG